MTLQRALPAIDISRLCSTELSDRLAVARELDCACSESGFLYITGQQIDFTVFDRLLDRAKRYFAQDRATKMASYIGLSENHSGYVPAGEERFEGAPADRKEAYDINFDYLPREGRRPLLGPNLWPAMPGFREDVGAYYRHVTGIGRQLFGAFALALDLEEQFFTPHLQNPPSQLRMLHYPFDPGAEDCPGIGAHTDYEFFTLLFATAPGLQIVDAAGRWADVPLVEGAMVMNIGDMLEVLSNGRYLATRHRVKQVKEERYSFALFHACDYDFCVAPAVRGETPRYAPIEGGTHLFDQTARTFAYLKQRCRDRQLPLEQPAPPRIFGRQCVTA